MIEAQVRYVMSLLKQMKRRRWRAVEVKREKEEAWNNKIQAKIAKTVWLTGGCKSWYLDESGRNTPPSGPASSPSISTRQEVRTSRISSQFNQQEVLF